MTKRTINLQSGLLKPRFERGIMELYRERPERTHVGLSQMGEGCERKIWYEHRGLGINDEPPPEVIMRWKVGEMMEAYMMECLAADGVVFSRDTVEVEYMGVKGHMDNVVDFAKSRATELDNELMSPYPIAFENGGRKWGLEAKTTGSTKFQTLLRGGLERAFPGYWHQCQSYLAGYEATHGESLAGMSIMVINLASGAIDPKTKLGIEAIYEEVIPYMPSEISGRIAYVASMLNSPNKPKRPFPSPDNNTCLYCLKQSYCWGDTD